MAVRWVVFDLNGTLLDPGPISGGLPAPLNDEAMGLTLLHDTVFQAMADCLAGGYRPFTEYLAAAVRRRLALAGQEHGPGVDSAVESAVTAARALPAYPEAEAALDALAGAGLRIATVTNSPTETAERSLDAAGLRERFAHVVGSETCRAYKPSLDVYRNGLSRIGAEPGEAVMIASHAWDLLGAHRSGMRTAWVSRGEEIRLETMPVPDATGADLLETAHSIVAFAREHG